MITISVLALAFLLASVLHTILGEAKETSGETTAPPPANNSYELKAYSLNYTSVVSTANGTAFFFDAAQLPVNFSSIQFGDFRSDIQYRSTYYAGSGILLNASGPNASITLKEGNGKLIGRVFYHGQRLVVLTGQTATYINCSNQVVYNGTDLMVQDWRSGKWSPNDGILIEHPKNVSMTGARFCLAVYQPCARTQMPEFELLPVIILVLLVLVLARRYHR